MLATLGERRRAGQVLVGFAAETGEGGLERAREKLARKDADLFVFNDVSRPDIGFDATDNEVTLLAASGERDGREGTEGGDRSGDPRRGGDAARMAERAVEPAPPG